MLGAAIVPRQRPLTSAPTTIAPVVAGLLAHLALAPLLRDHASLATLHAAITIMVAVGTAAITPWINHIANVAGYLVGAELLWRMSEARVPYELGKYALIVVLGIGILRMGRPRRMFLPVSLVALLLPSIVLTVEAFGFAGAREALSFNLSGPFAIAVSVLFFGYVRASWLMLQQLLWAVVMPIAGVAAFALSGTIAAGSDLVFSNASNSATSGGFGPNQVSAVLGLGALLALVLGLRETRPAGRVVGIVAALWLVAQGALTFSRGGLVNVAVALLLAATFALREPQRTSRLIIPMVVVVLVGGLVVYPRLVAFTGDAFEQRFTDLSLEDRQAIVDVDLQMFRDHPLLGVGPGVGRLYRLTRNGQGISAHTEFTRLPAEHGLAGILAIAVLLAMVARAYRAAPTSRTRAWVLLLSGWVLSEMSHGAVRMAIIPFVFGLTACQLAPDEGAPAADGD